MKEAFIYYARAGGTKIRKKAVFYVLRFVGRVGGYVFLSEHSDDTLIMID